MRGKLKIALVILVVAALAVACGRYLSTANIPILSPHGTVGESERNLILLALGLSTVVVIPVYTMLFVFALKYRESNPKKHKYAPNSDRNRVLELIWWGVPSFLILILSVVTWTSSHRLDPYKPLASSQPALVIQVVALDWKWLFIYPNQQIASVNEVALPVGRPVTFHVTSDAPMNSFWIPQLGGQIYAMPGMSTELNLEADQAGTYDGWSANISGDGFAGMNFKAKALSQTDFDRWIQNAGRSQNRLDQPAYDMLAAPSQNVPVSYYSNVTPGLYDKVVMKYMTPPGGLSIMPGMAN